MIRNILKGSDNERLRATSREVTEWTPRLDALMNDMWETLADAQGAGLAAPQIGVLRRIVIIDWAGQKYELINPVIVSQEGSVVDEEGCLSITEGWYHVERPERVTVKAQGRDGQEHTYTGEGRLARAFAHELDHLDGVLVTDHAIGDVIK